MLKDLVVDFFTSLFSSNPEAGGVFAKGMFPPLEKDARQRLDELYTIEEVSKALKGMGPLKAPRPDGFHALFFQKTWSKTGPALTNFVLGALKGGAIQAKVAGALLVLILTEESPESVKSFRPISLCNTCTKVVTKVIANRLKGILNEVVYPNQVSLIPGRQAIDNVVICQEIIHSLRYITARSAGMVVKIELVKAYDRMEWGFVEETLKDVSLPTAMINVIMGLIRQSHCKLIWKGEITYSIKSTIGLRHGDPLSPYLFVLCLERLSQWILSKVNEGRWRSLTTSR